MTYLKPIRLWPDIHRVPASRAKISRNCTFMHIKRHPNIFIRCKFNPFLWIIPITINCNRMTLFRWRYTGCSPGTSSFITYFLLKQRIVPFLTRLVGDLTGMEAGWETTIGDKK
jgi:hypothetical protein